MNGAAVRLEYLAKPPTDATLGCLAVFCAEGAVRPPARLEPALLAAFRSVAALKEFTGKAGQVVTVPTGQRRVPRLLLAGLGPAGPLGTEAVRRAAGCAAKHLRTLNLARAGVLLPGGLKNPQRDDLAEALAEGLLLGAYVFEPYKRRSDSATQRLERVTVFDPERAGSAKGVAAGRLRAEAVCLARDLGNHPANAMTPTRLAAESKRIARRHGLTVRVLERAQLERLGMGLLLGVAQGSANRPS